MVKHRKTLNVFPETLKKMKRLQAKIELEKGVRPSLEEIAKKVINSPFFDKLEKEILKSKIKLGIKID